jgi:hypothetical protein
VKDPLKFVLAAMELLRHAADLIVILRKKRFI